MMLDLSRAVTAPCYFSSADAIASLSKLDDRALSGAATAAAVCRLIRLGPREDTPNYWCLRGGIIGDFEKNSK
jgi:hypothetical protein